LRSPVLTNIFLIAFINLIVFGCRIAALDEKYEKLSKFPDSDVFDEKAFSLSIAMAEQIHDSLTGVYETLKNLVAKQRLERELSGLSTTPNFLPTVDSIRVPFYSAFVRLASFTSFAIDVDPLARLSTSHPGTPQPRRDSKVSPGAGKPPPFTGSPQRSPFLSPLLPARRPEDSPMSNSTGNSNGDPPRRSFVFLEKNDSIFERVQQTFVNPLAVNQASQLSFADDEPQQDESGLGVVNDVLSPSIENYSHAVPPLRAEPATQTQPPQRQPSLQKVVLAKKMVRRQGAAKIDLLLIFFFFFVGRFYFSEEAEQLAKRDG